MTLPNEHSINKPKLLFSRMTDDSLNEFKKQATKPHDIKCFFKKKSGHI